MRTCCLTVFLFLSGCAQDATHSADACKHGPHGGNLISLGDDSRIEVTADREKGVIAFHLLDTAGKETRPAPIHQWLLALDGTPGTIPLSPKPADADPADTCSCYQGKLPEQTKGRRLAGTLRIVVDGKERLIPFRHCPACSH